MKPFQPAPPLPPRTTSDQNKDSDSFWKEPLGALLAILLAVAILFSACCLLRYAVGDQRVYNELVDYLDKTISISKINYNSDLGLYEVTEKEMDVLHNQRKYKTLVWIFLVADLGNFIFLTIALMLYYSADTSKGTMHVIFWTVLGIGVIYCFIEGAIFSGLLFPLSARLPNETSTLLDHAIPHNPGGIIHIEQGLGCTFDHSLYNNFQRRSNPKNTCDPHIASSYIPRSLLVTFMLLRLIALAIFFALLIATPLGGPVAALISKTRPEGGYKNKFIKNPNYKSNNVGIHTPKSTTFGVKDNRPVSSNPPATPPVNIDHSIRFANVFVV
ncbi:hypothetical protein FO519_001342 [Halicephalobus sp. NKZ332]|nr:hypothetical protein FO519_001342 [Halicephalobus sp. NKZ332]